MPEAVTGQHIDNSAAQQAEDQRVAEARAELADEQGIAPEAEGEQQSELILGKYKSPEELAKAYQALQAEYTRVKQGLPPDKAQQQSDEQAKVQEVANAIIQQAGGQDQYAKLARWAVDNLPQDRQERYNKALESRDVEKVLIELKGIQYDYLMANGYEPRLAGGRTNRTPDVQPFTSDQEVVAAMSDPRYSGPQADPTYIREVEARLRASTVFPVR